MQINTVQEQDAYDKGFADAKDYWGPQEQERIIKLLEGLKNFDLTSPQRIEHRMALEVMLNKLKEELIKGKN